MGSEKEKQNAEISLNYFKSSQNSSKIKEFKNKALIEASPYIFVMIFQTRKKTGYPVLTLL